MASHNSQNSEKPVIEVRGISPPPATHAVKLRDASSFSHPIIKETELVQQMVRFYVGEVTPDLRAALHKSEKEKRQLEADVKRLVGVVRELGGDESACLRNDRDISAHHSMCEQEASSREHDDTEDTSHLFIPVGDSFKINELFPSH